MDLMQLAYAAERLSQGRPAVTVDAKRCLHSIDKDSPCDLCVRECPTGAIQLENGIHVDADSCIRCGLCLHRCPTGVFDGADKTPDLLRCGAQLAEHDQLEIACQYHPNPAIGARGVDAVVQVDGCLCSLGVSAYIGLLALGFEGLRVRLDSCESCPLQDLQDSIEDTIETAAVIAPGRVRKTEGGRRWLRATRPVVSVKNPPMTRRGFFRALAMQSNQSVEAIAPQHDPQVLQTRSAPRERRRLVRAMKVRPELVSSLPGFSQMRITGDCTACSLCARVCPTGALVFNRNDEHFEIIFKPEECTQCGMCLRHCETDALYQDGMPIPDDVLGSTAQLLYKGQLQQCRRCKAKYTGDSNEGLCSVCANRKRDPFRVHLTEEVLDRLPESARQRLQSSSTSTT